MNIREKQDFKTYGDCMKCLTPDSEVFLLRRGYYVGKACGCWDEEVEHDSGRSKRKMYELESLRRIISHSHI